MTDPRLDRPVRPPARALLWLARALLPVRRDAPAPGALRRVLIVRTDDRVGNALLTIPLARALQQALPGAEIHLLLAARRAQVARGLPGITVLPFDKRDALRHPLRFARFLRALRRGGYDAVIDAAHWHSFSVTSALLARVAARGFLVGPDRGPRGFYSATEPLPAPGTPEVAAKVFLAHPLGLAPQVPPLETALGRGPSPLGPAPYAVLNPGARKADHRLPAGLFAAAARALARRGIRPVVLYGPGEEEVAREVVRDSGGAAVLGPPTDLEGLAAAFRGAAVVITNDTGPLHLAVACGSPVLALLHAEEGRRWTHPGPRFTALVAPRPEAVAEAAVALLDTGGRAAAPSPAPEEPA